MATSFSIKKRRGSPDDEYPPAQVLQASSYSPPVGLNLGPTYIPNTATSDIDSASGSERYSSPDKLTRSIQEATTVAVKSGITESSLIKRVQAEWRHHQHQHQQQHHHKVKRLQDNHHHHHRHITVKRHRGPQQSRLPAQPHGQHHLELRRTQTQYQQPSPFRQTYQYQLHDQQPHYQPLYQQAFYQQQSFHPQSYEQQSEYQYLQQPYYQQPEQHFQPQQLHVITNFPMPANYSAEIGEEKAVPSLHSSPSSSDSCSPSWMTARVVTRWLCGGDTEPTYQPVPQTTSYEHVGSTSVVNAGASSIMPEEPIGSSQPISFACDRGLWGQGELLPNWTPMQPTRVTEVQPPATKEEMLYPDESPSTLASNQGHPVLHTHNYCTGYLPSPPLKSEPASASSSSDSSPFLSQGGFSFVSLSLNQGPLIDIYDVNDEQANQAALLAPTAPAPLRTHTRPPAAKRGPFKDNEQRLKTALTRKMGSCIRCRMQRIRCVLDDHDKDGPCLACRKLLENGTSIYRPSCARLKITDMKLFKPGQVRGFEWTQRWKGSIVDDIGTWESVEIRKIEVTEGYTGGSMKLEVRRFKPQEGDKLDRTWVSARGEKKKVAVPPYAIVNMDAAATDIKRYLRDYRQACFKALLGSQDNLIYKTYALALERAGHSNPFVTLAEKQLLVNTLDLWFSIRLSTKSFEIVGEDLLEMPKDIIDDRSSDQYGKVPIPPVLGAQLDSILIHQILAKYRRTVLEDLSKMVQEKKPSTWLTIYLATFILLHNAALITKHDAGYAKKHGMNRRFARPEEVKEYNVAAQTVLHYYHYCNKGIYPFTSECKDYELSSLAELDDHGIEMVHFTRKVAAEQKEHWESLWAEDKYEDESYYLSQLYEAGWKARLMG